MAWGIQGDIIGVVVVLSAGAIESAGAVLPSELRSATTFVRPGTMAFIAGENGDLYVLLPNGAVFVKSQGAWRYLNYQSFHALLSQHLSPYTIARAVLQIALDLSFLRRGALLVLPSEGAPIEAFVPHHCASSRPNHALRLAGSNVDLLNPAQIPVLLGAAGADGAVVVARNGRVIDAACMIGQPDLGALEAVGQRALKRYEGARTTAPWNASAFGVAIRVSEDGPLSLFVRGELVGQIG